MTHTNLGDITLPVGSYESNGTTKKRYRKIGVLMKTQRDDGTEGYWLRLNADILHASLYALASRAGMEKGDDAISANVFAQKERPKAATGAAAAEEAEADEIPF